MTCINMLGVIFDLDGTLVNSLEDLIDSCNAILKYNRFPPILMKRAKN